MPRHVIISDKIPNMIALRLATPTEFDEVKSILMDYSDYRFTIVCKRVRINWFSMSKLIPIHWLRLHINYILFFSFFSFDGHMYESHTVPRISNNTFVAGYWHNTRCMHSCKLYMCTFPIFDMGSLDGLVVGHSTKLCHMQTCLWAVAMSFYTATAHILCIINKINGLVWPNYVHSFNYAPCQTSGPFVVGILVTMCCVWILINKYSENWFWYVFQFPYNANIGQMQMHHKKLFI